MSNAATGPLHIADGVSVILHIGLGAFHRAHQAVYLERLRASGERDWMLCAGSIRADAVPQLEALAAQGGAYTLETVTPEGEHSFERIEAIGHVVPFSPELVELIELGADPHTKIISFTVTEAGYYLDDRGRLDRTAADLAADLDGRTRRTIYGAVTAILHKRRVRDAGPVTLLNCDNLRHNGDCFGAGLREFIALRGDHALAAWLDENVTCPNAMVDRITPRAAPDLPARVRAATGRSDAAPVMAESFLQWVIEDRFCNDRPPLERVGVQFVESVQPYEEAKIRILNASHSCIAWAGSLRGYATIDQGVHDASIRQFAADYVTRCVVPCLEHGCSPYPVDLARYRDTVLARFGNAALRDTNRRVAMDGYSKIPGFIVPTIRECFELGVDPTPVMVLPALFFVFLQEWACGRLRDPYDDQVMDPERVRAMLAAPDAEQAFVADAQLWGTLAGQPRLQQAFDAALLRVRAWRTAAGAPSPTGSST